MKKVLFSQPVLEKEMIRQQHNTSSINEIQGLKGVEAMTIAGTSSTYQITILEYFRHKNGLPNIS